MGRLGNIFEPSWGLESRLRGLLAGFKAKNMANMGPCCHPKRKKINKKSVQKMINFMLALGIAFFQVFWFSTDGIPIRQRALFGRQIGSPKREHSKTFHNMQREKRTPNLSIPLSLVRTRLEFADDWSTRVGLSKNCAKFGKSFQMATKICDFTQEKNEPKCALGAVDVFLQARQNPKMTTKSEQKKCIHRLQIACNFGNSENSTRFILFVSFVRSRFVSFRLVSLRPATDRPYTP